MSATTYTLESLQAATGIQARTLRHWIRHKLLPKPNGRGRAARYDARHLLRARVVLELRRARHSLSAIHYRIASLSEPQLTALLPPAPRALTPEGLPVPPPEPNYPHALWEMVPLMDGLTLMVNTTRGPALRRIANEIYRYYGAAPDGPAR